MPHHDIVSLEGEIADVFAHRFTLATAKGRVLADLGPSGAAQFALTPGARVRIEGERKPSEIKVTRIGRTGEPAIEIAHRPKGPHHRGPHHHHHADADPQAALAAARAAGYATAGSPQRKPKHFEVLARRSAGEWVELHVELDGAIRKAKPLPADGGKWASALVR